MKTTLALLAALTIQAAAQSVQYTALYTTNAFNVSYPVRTNDAVAMVSGVNVGSGLVGTCLNGSTVVLSTGSVYAGMTNITLLGSAGFYKYATLSITSPIQPVNTISNYVPADAIVIPTSATGNVQLIMESSQDLVNWVGAMPGTYGASSATNRFFRLRAVHN